MVRETRYLWVGNLPEQASDEKIAEHFKRYGKIQSVKLRKDADENIAGALVAFTDIKSASKAHGGENVLDGHVLHTEYSEPTATTGGNISRPAIDPSSYAQSQQRGRTAAPPPRYSSRPEGSTDFERPGEYFGNRTASSEQFDGRRQLEYNDSEEYQQQQQQQQQPRGRQRERYSATAATNRNTATYPAPPPPARTFESRDQPKSTIGYQRYASEEQDAENVSERSKRPQSQVYAAKKGQKWGPSPSQSRSRSSSSSSSHSSSSSSSGSHSRAQSRSSSNQRHASLVQKVESGEEEKGHLGILISNLPMRSSDSSLRDGLFHEYKKFGKVTAVSIQGEADGRLAVISFKKHDDATKALEASRDKTFFGKKITAQAHEGIEPDDCEFRPPEAELDEYHPKATRTLFVGNLEKDITTQELRSIFKDYGDILDVDIKKQGAVSAYAFVQYTDITSVVRALRKMDGENIGANKIKLGFGKSMPTNCIWLDCVAETIVEKFLMRHFGRHGHASHCVMDRHLGRALIFYDSVEYAQYALNEMRGRILGAKRIQIDFASRDCQTDFYDKLEATGQLRPGDRPEERPPAAGSVNPPAAGGRYNRAPSEQYEPRGYQAYGDNRPSYRNNAQNRPGRAQFRNRGRSFYNSESGSYDDIGGERRRRHFDEFSQGSNTSFMNDDSYEQELRDYSFGQRERRDFDASPSPPRERRVESRDGSPFRRLPAQYEQYDRYPERYGERYRDTDSQGELDNARGGGSGGDPRRDFRDRYGFDDKHERKPRHRRSESLESGSSMRRSMSPSERRKEKVRRVARTLGEPVDDFAQSQRSHSPMDFDEAYREYKHKERRIKEKEESERTKHSTELRGKKLRGVGGENNAASWKSAYDSDSSRSDASDSERKWSTEKGGAAKRLRDEILEDSEAASNWKLLQRQHSSRSLSSSGSRGKKDIAATAAAPAEPMEACSSADVVVVASGKTELDLHERTRKDEAARRLKDEDEALKNIPAEFSPPSDNSDQDSEIDESQQSSVDLTKLQKEKLQLLMMLKQLDDGGSGSDNEQGAGGDDKRANKRAKLVEDVLEDTRKFQRHGDDHKSEQSYRKQMEARRHQMEEEVRVLKQKANKFAAGDKHRVDVEEGEMVSETERDIAPDNLARKKRKFSDISPDVKPKRSYRTKSSSEGIISMSDDEFASRNAEPDMHIFKSPSVNEDRPTDIRIEVGEDGNLRRPDGSSRSPARDRRHRDFGDDKRELSLPLPKFALLLCNMSPRVQQQQQQQSSEKQASSPKLMSPQVLVSPAPSSTEKTTPQVSPDIPKQDSENDESRKADSTETTPKARSKKKPDSLSLSGAGFGSPLTDDSLSPKSPSEISLEERIRRLDEKLSKTESVRAPVVETVTPPAPTAAVTTPITIDYQKYKIKKRQDSTNSMPPPPEKKAEPSDIVKSLLSRSSIFDEDAKRLERINEKYEPKDYTNLEADRLGFRLSTTDPENSDDVIGNNIDHVTDSVDLEQVPEIISSHTSVSPTSILKKSPMKEKDVVMPKLPLVVPAKTQAVVMNVFADTPPAAAAALTSAASCEIAASEKTDDNLFVKPESPLLPPKKSPVAQPLIKKEVVSPVKLETEIERNIPTPGLKKEVVEYSETVEVKQENVETVDDVNVKIPEPPIEDSDQQTMIHDNAVEEAMEVHETPPIPDVPLKQETRPSLPEEIVNGNDDAPSPPVGREVKEEIPPPPPPLELPVEKPPEPAESPEQERTRKTTPDDPEPKNLHDMVSVKNEENKDVSLAEARPDEGKNHSSNSSPVNSKNLQLPVAKNDEALPPPNTGGAVAAITSKTTSDSTTTTTTPSVISTAIGTGNTSTILGKRKHEDSNSPKDCTKPKSFKPEHRHTSSSNSSSNSKTEKSVDKLAQQHQQQSDHDLKKLKNSSSGSGGSNHSHSSSSVGSTSKNMPSGNHSSKDRKESSASKSSSSSSSTSSSSNKSSHHKTHSKSPEKKIKTPSTSSTSATSSTSVSSSSTKDKNRENERKDMSKKDISKSSSSSSSSSSSATNSLEKKVDDKAKIEMEKERKREENDVKKVDKNKLKDSRMDKVKVDSGKFVKDKKDSKSSDVKNDKKHEKVKSNRIDMEKKEIKVSKPVDPRCKDDDSKKEKKSESKNSEDAQQHGKTKSNEGKIKEEEPKKSSKDDEIKKSKPDSKIEKKDSKNKLNEAKGKEDHSKKEEKKTDVKKPVTSSSKIEKTNDEQKLKFSKTGNKDNKPDQKESDLKKIAEEKDKKKKQEKEKNDKKGDKKKDSKKDRKDKDHDGKGPDGSGKDKPKDNDHDKDKENREKDREKKDDRNDGREQKDKSKDETKDKEADSGNNNKEGKKKMKDDRKKKEKEKKDVVVDDPTNEDWLKNILLDEPEQFTSMYDKIKRRSSKEAPKTGNDNDGHKFKQQKRSGKNNNKKSKMPVRIDSDDSDSENSDNSIDVPKRNNKKKKMAFDSDESDLEIFRAARQKKKSTMNKSAFLSQDSDESDLEIIRNKKKNNVKTIMHDSDASDLELFRAARNKKKILHKTATITRDSDDSDLELLRMARKKKKNLPKTQASAKLFISSTSSSDSDDDLILPTKKKPLPPVVNKKEKKADNAIYSSSDSESFTPVKSSKLKDHNNKSGKKSILAKLDMESSSSDEDDDDIKLPHPKKTVTESKPKVHKKEVKRDESKDKSKLIKEKSPNKLIKLADLVKEEKSLNKKDLLKKKVVQKVHHVSNDLHLKSDMKNNKKVKKDKKEFSENSECTVKSETIMDKKKSSETLPDHRKRTESGDRKTKDDKMLGPPVLVMEPKDDQNKQRKDVKKKKKEKKRTKSVDEKDKTESVKESLPPEINAEIISSNVRLGGVSNLNNDNDDSGVPFFSSSLIADDDLSPPDLTKSEEPTDKLEWIPAGVTSSSTHDVSDDLKKSNKHKKKQHVEIDKTKHRKKPKPDALKKLERGLHASDTEGDMFEKVSISEKSDDPLGIDDSSNLVISEKEETVISDFNVPFSDIEASMAAPVFLVNKVEQESVQVDHVIHSVEETVSTTYQEPEVDAATQLARAVSELQKDEQKRYTPEPQLIEEVPEYLHLEPVPDPEQYPQETTVFQQETDDAVAALMGMETTIVDATPPIVPDTRLPFNASEQPTPEKSFADRSYDGADKSYEVTDEQPYLIEEEKVPVPPRTPEVVIETPKKTVVASSSSSSSLAESAIITSSDIDTKPLGGTVLAIPEHPDGKAQKAPAAIPLATVCVKPPEQEQQQEPTTDLDTSFTTDQWSEPETPAKRKRKTKQPKARSRRDSRRSSSKEELFPELTIEEDTDRVKDTEVQEEPALTNYTPQKVHSTESEKTGTPTAPLEKDDAPSAESTIVEPHKSMALPSKPIPSIMDDPCDDFEPESPGALHIDMSGIEGDENEAPDNDDSVAESSELSQLSNQHTPSARRKGKRNRRNNQRKDTRQRPVAVVAPNEIAPTPEKVEEFPSNILQEENLEKDPKFSESSSESFYSEEKSPRILSKDSPRSVSPRAGLFLDRDSPRRKSPGRQGNVTPPISDIKSRLRPVSKRRRSRRCSFPEYDDREIVRDAQIHEKDADIDAIVREKKLSEYDFRDDDEALEPTASFKEFESKMERFEKLEPFTKLEIKEDFMNEKDDQDMEKWTEVSLTDNGIKLKRHRRNKVRVGRVLENVPPISKMDIAADLANKLPTPPSESGKELLPPYVKLEKLQIVEEKLKKEDPKTKEDEEDQKIVAVEAQADAAPVPVEESKVVIQMKPDAAAAAVEQLAPTLLSTPVSAPVAAAGGKDRKSRRNRRKKSYQGGAASQAGGADEHNVDLYEFRDDSELQAEVIEMAARAAIEAAEDHKEGAQTGNAVPASDAKPVAGTPDRELMPPPIGTSTSMTMLKSPPAVSSAAHQTKSPQHISGLDQVLMEEARSPCISSDGNHSQDEHALVIDRERHDSHSSSDHVEAHVPPVKEKRRRKKEKKDKEKKEGESGETSVATTTAAPPTAKEKMDEAMKNEFLSNIDRIIEEVSRGNFDNKSIEDDPDAPPRRRGSRSSSKHDIPHAEKPVVSSTPTAVIQPLHQGPPLPPQNPLVALQQQGFSIPSMDAMQEKSDVPATSKSDTHGGNQPSVVHQSNHRNERERERDTCRPPFPGHHPHLPNQHGDKSVISPITPSTPVSQYQESMSRIQHQVAVSQAGQPAAMKSPIGEPQHPPVGQPFPRPEELGKLPPGVPVSSHQLLQDTHAGRHHMIGYPSSERSAIERQVQMERCNDERRLSDPMMDRGLPPGDRLTPQSAHYTQSQFGDRVPPPHHGQERVFNFQHDRPPPGSLSRPPPERSPGGHHPNDRLMPQQERQPSKSPTGKMSPRSAMGVHVGVVKGQPYPIGQRETLQGQVIERVPNPNNGQEPPKLHSPKGGNQPLLSPDQLKRDQLHAQQMAYVKNSELRAMLSQPSRLAAQHQQLIQQQLHPPNAEHHRHSPNTAQHRMPFAIQDRPSHAEPKGPLDPRHAHEAKLMNDVAVRHPGVSAFTSPDVRMPHPDHHPNLPPGHIFHPELGLQHPGMPPYLGVPRMGMDPRMIFPPGQPPPEYITHQGQLMVAPQQYLHPDNRLTPETRPPSRPLSAHGPPPGRPPLPELPNHPDSLMVLLQKYPVMWQGILALKNDNAAVQMHFVSGNSTLVKLSMPGIIEGLPAPLRIAQRMRLEPTQLDGVSKRMQNDEDYCMLLALPCGRDHIDVMQQTRQLTIGFIDYLRQKQAAGIVNVPGPGSNQTAYVVHIFPPCEFSRANLAQLAPDLLQSVAGVTEVAHLLIVIATV